MDRSPPAFFNQGPSAHVRLALCALATAAALASAQTPQRLEAPTAEEILEQLAPPPGSGARPATRSLGTSRSLNPTRNLAVQERSVDLIAAIGIKWFHAASSSRCGRRVHARGPDARCRAVPRRAPRGEAAHVQPSPRR